MRQYYVISGYLTTNDRNRYLVVHLLVLSLHAWTFISFVSSYGCKYLIPASLLRRPHIFNRLPLLTRIMGLGHPMYFESSTTQSIESPFQL
jgi:hypothetical protein